MAQIQGVLGYHMAPPGPYGPYRQNTQKPGFLTLFDPFSPPEHPCQDGPSTVGPARCKWPITLISGPSWHYGSKGSKTGHFGPPFWTPFWPFWHSWPDGPSTLRPGKGKWPITLISGTMAQKGSKRGPKRVILDPSPEPLLNGPPKSHAGK